jgi:hypothetical protein
VVSQDFHYGTPATRVKDYHIMFDRATKYSIIDGSLVGLAWGAGSVSLRHHEKIAAN